MMLEATFLSCLVFISTSAAPNPNVNMAVDIKVDTGSTNKGQAISDIQCGIETPAEGSNRIVNGAFVNIPRQYSWQVGLYREPNIVNIIVPAFCGGSIINDKYVLTAAHCAYDIPKDDRRACRRDTKPIFVAIGSNKQIEIKIFIEVIDRNFHNFNCKTLNNDIALLELRKSISALLVSGYIHPICLPSDDTEDYAGKSAIVTGWGSTIGWNPPPSTTPNPSANAVNQLKEALVPVMSNDECINDVPILTPNMLCTSTGQGFAAGANDSCQGDSGGPLFYKETKQHVQIGVVSFARGCASKGNPGVYARVSKYIMWIELMAGKIYKIT